MCFPSERFTCPKYIKELDPKDIAEYHLIGSESKIKTWMQNQLNNVLSIMKSSCPPFIAKRNYIAIAYGHPSISMRLGG